MDRIRTENLIRMWHRICPYDLLWYISQIEEPSLIEKCSSLIDKGEKALAFKEIYKYFKEIKT